jgi:ATP phosphoribosyltransferase regulatory subunit
LKWLASHLDRSSCDFDLADLRGYAYYSGCALRFMRPAASDALVRGGRYDEVGAVFGRNRPAAGFSLDVKALVAAAAACPACRPSVRPGASGRRCDVPLRLCARGRDRGCVLPGHESEVDEFHCDRELSQLRGNGW